MTATDNRTEGPKDENKLFETIEHGRIDPDRAADAAPGPFREGDDPKQRQEQLLDEGIEETFPGSDPVSVKRIT